MLKYALCTLALLVTTVVHAADDKVKATCPVTGKAADAAISTEYNGGKVYFASKEAAATFKKEEKKYAAKANWQLVQTGQFVQAKCPFAGKDVNPEANVTVGGVKVAFCCENCQGKAAKAEGDAQVNLIFGDAAFKKGFTKK